MGFSLTDQERYGMSVSSPRESLRPWTMQIYEKSARGLWLQDPPAKPRLAEDLPAAGEMRVLQR